MVWAAAGTMLMSKAVKNWPCLSLAAVLKIVRPAPQLGSIIKLALVARMQASGLAYGMITGELSLPLLIC